MRFLPFAFSFLLCFVVYWLVMSQQNKHCPGEHGKVCGKSMPFWDNHVICRSCRGDSCSVSSPCDICSLWSEDVWKKHSKCILRSDKAKTSVRAKSVSSYQAPGNKRHSDISYARSMPRSISSVYVDTVDGSQEASDHETSETIPRTRDQATHSAGHVRRSRSPDVHAREVAARSDTPMGLPRQYRLGSPTSRDRQRRSSHVTRRQSSSSSLSSFSDSSGRSRASRHRRRRSHRRSRSRSRSTRLFRRGRRRRSRSYSRRRSSPRRDRSTSRVATSVRPVEAVGDPAVTLLSKLVEQQGQALKDLTSRLDSFIPKPNQSQAMVDAVESVGSGEEHTTEPTDLIQIHIGSDEKIGESDNDCQEEDSPKDSLSYGEAIVKLRSRLGPGVCPFPEVKSTPVGASALDFFKDPSKHDEISLALPQSNSVMVSLKAMNKRLKGDEEIPMTPLPSYPKALKPNTFVQFSAKPKIFRPSSYEPLKPVFNLDPPAVNPGLKDVSKQGFALPSSHSIQFSTLEGWEKLARMGIQVASHSEMFLCGTLKTIQQDSLSKEDMLEVSRYLQAVAMSQSHLVEILTRLASGPLLARRDACLGMSDLDNDTKQSLRVQPIESSTVLGDKFPEVVKQYKDNLAHRSLQMAVTGANKSQSSLFKKKPSKLPDPAVKPNSNLTVTVGPNSSRAPSFSQPKPFNRPQKKPGFQSFRKPVKKGKDPKPSYP